MTQQGNPPVNIEAVDSFMAAALRGDAPAWPQGWDDLDLVWQRIEFHGVALILADQPDILADWPAPLRAVILEEAQLQVFWEESHRSALAGILATMGPCDIPLRIMKGTALAYSVYDNPAVRRRGDTDLLVRESDLMATRKVLRKQGWAQRDDPHGLFFQETWLHDTGFGMIHAIDLHWQPNDSPALQRVLRIEEYFAQAVPLPGLSPHAKAPSHVLTFLQGAMNQAWHRAKGYFVGEERVVGGHRLIWSLDSHLLATQFGKADWERLASLACSREIAPIVLASIQAAERDFGSAIPAAAKARLRAAPQDTSLSRYLLTSDQKREFLADLGASRGLGAKARFLLANAFPAPRHLHRKYPEASGWPTPLLHLRRLAGLAARSIGIGTR